MPQASNELRAKFPGYDAEALDVISENFTVSRAGVITKKVQDYELTQRERDAINYLFHEWDYGYHVL